MSDHNELEQLSAYLDGEFGASERASLEQHVAGCAECTRTLDAIRATIDDLATLPLPELDAGSISALDDSVAAERAARRTLVRRWGWVSGAAAAGVVIALVAVVTVVRDGAKKDTSLRSAAEQSAGAPVQDNSATNYTEESLAQALAAFGTTALGEGQAAPTQDGAFAGGSTRIEVAPKAFSAESDTRLPGCSQKIERADPDVRPVRFEVARFKGQEAFVLFYERPRTNPAYAEVWVVRPSDCETLYFAQRRL